MDFRKTVVLFLCCSVHLFAGQSPSNQPTLPEKKAYLKFESGASFSTKNTVTAPTSAWIENPKGYSDDFGVAPLFLVAFGYDIIPYLTTELSLSYRPHYSYKRSLSLDPNTPGLPNQGSITRHFHLDATSLLFSLFFNGRGFNALKWEVGPSNSYIYPLIGGGLGISELTIYDFRTTGLDPIPGIDFKSFGSENEYTKRYRFTYQVIAGFSYRLLSDWGFELGYRWFSTMRFRGPSYFRNNTGDAANLTGYEWKQRLSAHEVFANVKYYF